MKKSCFLLIFLINILNNFIYGQNLSDSLFHSPLKIPLKISGGFGEYRANHIHSGIDLKTNGEIGQKVYAAASGYVSRIKVEPGGFGKAIYIDHPEGYTTVYGHLDAFRDDITQYVRKQQYELQQFQVDLFPNKEDFVVKSGDSIAFSGNSGGSTGPHLHFEIRELVKQSPIEPLLFKLPVIDKEPPGIYSLSLFPVSNKSMIFGLPQKINIPVESKDGKYLLQSDSIFSVSGPIGVGAEVFDALDSAASKTGFYKLSLQMDTSQACSIELKQFEFSETRYVNSLIDYETNFNEGRKITKLFMDPNNKLPVYKQIMKQGILEAGDTLVHKVTITAADAYDNQSQISFYLKWGDTLRRDIPKPMDTCFRVFSYQVENDFTNENFSLSIPKDALYNDFCLKYAEFPVKRGFYSKQFLLEDAAITPLQYPATISIKPESLPDWQLPKALIARISEKNVVSPVGGAYQNGYVKAKTYVLGKFAVVIDTLPPKILRQKNMVTNYDSLRREYIAFKITDNFSGIKDYKGYINDKWALFEYDAKNDLILHLLDPERFEYNDKTIIKIEVTDAKNNISTLVTKFTSYR